MTEKTRKIRSFVRREGRMTKGQQRALDELWPKFGIDYDKSLLNLDDVFQNKAPVILEIGFGMGHSLLEMAKQNPEVNYLGIEVHRPGVGTLLAAIEQEGIDNIRIMSHDAVEVLSDCIADNALDGALIFFPDPWPKKRHHKRRIIQTEFLNLLWKKLKADAFLHLATDWENYAEHMLDVIEQHTGYVNTAGKEKFIERPSTRPVTKFERRGKKLGHGVWDLLYKAVK